MAANPQPERVARCSLADDGFPGRDAAADLQALDVALQGRKVSGAAYWYLEKDDAPTAVPLPDVSESRERVLALARRVKEARESRAYECSRGSAGCFACQPFEAILRGEAEYLGVAGYGQDAYLV
jgi:hypothetical protein